MSYKKSGSIEDFLVELIFVPYKIFVWCLIVCGAISIIAVVSMVIYSHFSNKPNNIKPETSMSAISEVIK